MDAVKQRPVLEDAATRDEFSKAPCVGSSEFRPHREDRFGLSGKIEGILCFVKVESAHPVPVVEQSRRFVSSIDCQTVEHPIQTGGKVGILFVDVSQVGRSVQL